MISPLIAAMVAIRSSSSYGWLSVVSGVQPKASA
jgi:hypothetical protein